MPTFTPFLPRRQFLPHQAFYPNFTPFLVLSGLQFPRFYPKGKTAHFLLLMRRLDFWNIADTTEMNDSLRLRPSMHPFVTALPSTSPSLPFWRPSLIPQFATRRNQGCAKSCVVMWKANKVSRQTSGQSARVLVPKGSRWQQPQSTWCQPSGAHGLLLYPSTTSGLTVFTPFLPRLHPDCSYQ